MRPAIESDLPIFFLHQEDEDAAKVADFPSRAEEALIAHWQKIMADAENILRTVVVVGVVADNMVSFMMGDVRDVVTGLEKNSRARESPRLRMQFFYRK